MTFPSHSSPVPLFHSLEGGTMEQTLNQRNSSWNTSGTSSLKALANKVLEQNKTWNKPGTAASKSVPPILHSSSACGTVSVPSYRIEQKPSFDSVNSDELLDSFKERLAITEYDGYQNTTQAQRIAYLDAFISVLMTFPYEDTEGDWLSHRMKATQAWLLDQGMTQPK